MTLRRLLLVLFSLVLCTSSATGWAADTPAQETDATVQRARELFDKASALAKKRNYEQARKLFEEAWNLKKNRQTATGLGWGELTTDQYRLSAQHIAYALRVAPPDDDPADLRFCAMLYDKAKTRVATVHLRGVEQDTTVLVDSHPRDAMFQPDPVFLDPGTHTVEIRRPDGSKKTRVVEAEAGSTIELDMTPDLVAKAPASALPSPSVAAPTPASATPRPPPAASTYPGTYETSTHGWTPRTWTLVGEGTLAAAALGVGIGFALRASSLDSNGRSARAAVGSSSACRTASPQCTDLATMYHDRDTAATWAKVGVVTGGVLGVAAVTTLLLWPKPSTTAHSPFTVSPILGHATGIGVHGSF